MRIRLHRAATGVVAEAVEHGCDPGEGFQVRVIGAHDVEVPMLVEQLRLQVSDEICTAFLEPHPSRAGWLVREQEVAGRLVWAGDGGAPYAVVVDGRTVSWEEFGRALEPFEGWRFRLLIDDIDDVRAMGGTMTATHERDAAGPGSLDQGCLTDLEHEVVEHRLRLRGRGDVEAAASCGKDDS